MTELLEEAFTEVAKLSEAEQNLIANWILAELASERRWESSFAKSEDALALLAKEARAEYEMMG